MSFDKRKGASSSEDGGEFEFTVFIYLSTLHIFGGLSILSGGSNLIVGMGTIRGILTLG